jgi:glyoxylase-like metal-dependent hydrolase (beta-lactamase superfamily II)
MIDETMFQRLGHGITVIDTGFYRPRFDASYLIVENGRGAFVDTGPNDAVPRLLAALETQGLAPEAVDYVIATHVHLDHAGGVGLLMQHLPNARLVIHPRGARHMIDPSVLMEGARSVFGAEATERDYGEVVPVPAERVVTTSEGMVIELGGRPLRFMDTPGHARHHHCIWDEASRGWFTGDTFGIVYPELQTPQGPYIVPATAPPQFDQQALHESVSRLLANDPRWMYLTHYGAVGEPKKLAVQFLRQIDAMAQAALELVAEPNRHERLQQAFADIYLEELRRSGNTRPDAWLLDVLAVDLDLNAQGLAHWAEKTAERAQ